MKQGTKDFYTDQADQRMHSILARGETPAVVVVGSGREYIFPLGLEVCRAVASHTNKHAEIFGRVRFIVRLKAFK